MQISSRLSAALAAALVAAACGGGGGGGTTPTGPGTGGSGTDIQPGSLGAIITIAAGGALSSLNVRIERTQRVRFINNDTVPHQIQTNPHLLHTECPANNIIILNPGQQADTANFNEIKACGYHDHLAPENTKFHGLIRVGTDDESKGPIYSRGW